MTSFSGASSAAAPRLASYSFFAAALAVSGLGLLIFHKVVDKEKKGGK